MTESIPDDAGAAVPDEGFRRVFEAAPDGILVVDTRGRIREANPQAEEMFGYDREDLMGMEVEELVPEGVREAHRREREAYTDDPEPRPMGVGLELTGRRRDGSEFPVEISLSPMESRGETRVIAIVRDVTERRELRDFGAGTLRATEDERRRIARELHDDTAQRLASLLLRLRVGLRSAEGEQRQLLEEMRSEIVEAAEAVRRIARGLRPPSLESAGVESAIRTRLRDALAPSDLDLELDLAPVDHLLGQDSKLVLYRIVQEAVSNVVRHAEASRVQVELQANGAEVIVQVRDDGRGFRPPRVSGDGQGLGLLGMRERAHSVGGRLEVESEPGSGTAVRAFLPAEGDGEDREKKESDGP